MVGPDLSLTAGPFTDGRQLSLLLSREERRDYTLVGALQRRFGEFNIKDSLCSGFKHWVRQPGESLCTLAYNTESLVRRAYVAMPPMIQGELTRDQFIQALTPNKLCLHV